MATPWLGIPGSQPPQAWGLLVKGCAAHWSRLLEDLEERPLWEPGGLRLSQDPSQHTGWHSPGYLSAQHSSVPALATRTQASPVAVSLHWTRNGLAWLSTPSLCAVVPVP